MQLNEFIDYIEIMLKDEFVAEFEKKDNTLSITFVNGRKFIVNVAEK